ncbi:hypothetical protein SIID45300_02182 [Candidatus Magnetaquicoccaceae bacterium FCR-1]|uniref:Uncharacterized protein n=1 Tax=Candidatus Magnetaquiglobus chichijimensis TaxID=3141448 RepID=A0ABQ0CAE6_9PROT
MGIFRHKKTASSGGVVLRNRGKIGGLYTFSLVPKLGDTIHISLMAINLISMVSPDFRDFRISGFPG